LNAIIARGRKFTLNLFPLAQMEIGRIEQRYQTDANLENRLVFGAYPEIVLMQETKWTLWRSGMDGSSATK
jgi:predicted AAA+ superfamily ATPase